MKRILFITLITALVTGLFTSCENGDWEFPDYEYSSVYFAYQSPIRTICLGEDVFDTTLDNEWKAQIMATMGGVYANKSDVVISFRVDNSLTTGLAFADSSDIVALPANYYTLSSDRITIKKGEIIGGVVVQLTEAFFNDPAALTTNYVIPVVMTGVSGADTILSGKPLVANPRRGVASDWEVQPKDYVFYALKYINKYDAVYLRRGVDVISGSQTGTKTRRASFVERDEVVSAITTRSLNTIAWAHQTRDMNDFSRSCVLLLTFDNQGNCVVTTETAGVTVSGTGKFVSKGEKNSWGNKDRDAIYLDYTINYGDIQFAITDTLVTRDRGLKPEWFTSILK
ncbi:DUF5627 domain-containing protein [Alkaliflexus imshenetskii]|uniref:DUF5627 domain-containing protein n=1 Tax=Alkaliflexus imshenetskii TaxID=286730 RepID=UPI00047D5F7F|nr:DUF5627 domain-containing protein [Alkaliflexus imshenetskii]